MRRLRASAHLCHLLSTCVGSGDRQQSQDFLDTPYCPRQNRVPPRLLEITNNAEMTAWFENPIQFRDGFRLLRGRDMLNRISGYDAVEDFVAERQLADIRHTA